MKLAELTWKEVEALDREVVVVIPTGSLEQHGPHLPLFTDSILATAAAEAADQKAPQAILLTPTLWLGASGHHLKFAGSLSNDFDSYIGAIQSVVSSLVPHGFFKFYIVNGHGGNTEPNGVALRTLKAANPNLTLGHAGYFSFIPQEVLDEMVGPLKGIRHACEAEASLMMHVRPDLVRKDVLRDDGLESNPTIPGLIHHFDEITEEGSHGFATYARRETGKKLFEAAVEGLTKALLNLYNGYVLEQSTR